MPYGTAPAFFSRSSSLQSCSFCSFPTSSHCVLSANPFSFEFVCFASLHLLTYISCIFLLIATPRWVRHRPSLVYVQHCLSHRPIPSRFSPSRLTSNSDSVSSCLVTCRDSSTARAYGHKPGRANLLLTSRIHLYIHPSIPSLSLPIHPYDTHTRIVRVQHTYTIAIVRLDLYMYAAAVHVLILVPVPVLTLPIDTHAHHHHNATLLFLHPAAVTWSVSRESRLSLPERRTQGYVAVSALMTVAMYLSRHCIASVCGLRSARCRQIC